jgi:hypothetical protein
MRIAVVEAAHDDDASIWRMERSDVGAIGLLIEGEVEIHAETGGLPALSQET